jgi:hypothetical protein
MLASGEGSASQLLRKLLKLGDNMLADLDLPKLPQGFRWKFVINSIGNPELNLEQHVAFGLYDSIGYDLPATTVNHRGGTIEEAIKKGAEKLYSQNNWRWEKKQKVEGYIKYVGTSH